MPRGGLLFQDGCGSVQRLVHRLLVGLVSLVLLSCFGGSIWGAEKPEPRFHKDRILVKPKAGVDLAVLHAAASAQVHRAFKGIGGLQIVKVPAGANPKDLIARYKASGQVEYAELDYEVHLVDTPNDTYFADGTLWAMHNYGQNGGTAGADISAVPGWDIRNAAPNVIVAVIDTGIRYTHEDLAANMWTDPAVPGSHGINAISNNNDPQDNNGHGSHVSGTIGAVGNNGKGVVGVTRQVKLMGCKALNFGGSGNISDAITCINYAIAHGANIMSNSWGGTDFSQALLDAITAAGNAGIPFVCAAGNNTWNTDTTPFYPASYACPNIIAVASTNRNDALSSFSDYGQTTVHLGAPGEAIISCWNTSDSAYNTIGGTSMATPHVSGALALMNAQFPSLTCQQLKDALIWAVDPIPALTGKCVSNGRLNLVKAVTPPTAIFIVAGFPSTITAGTAGTFTLTVQDLNGNPNPGYRGTVRFASSDLTAGLPGNYMFVSGDGGVHTFTATLKKAGVQSITACDTANAYNRATQAGITVSPAAVTSLAISGLPTVIPPGANLSVTVSAKDAYANTVPSYAGTIKFTSSDAAAVLPYNYKFVSGDSGAHIFTVTLNTLGTQSITVTDTVVPSITGTQSHSVAHCLAIVTIAGSPGNPGSTDGTGSEARFHNPAGVAVDSSGNIYVADNGNNTIRKVTPGGVVTTLAGVVGSPGSTDGPGSTAQFHGPSHLAIDSSDNIFVADQGNSTIRMVTPDGVVSTPAGNPASRGSADGTGNAAQFYEPLGVAVDSSGNVYVADSYNYSVRKMTPRMTTQGKVYDVTTLAGSATTQGSTDGAGSVARFYAPDGITVNGSGNVFVTDYTADTVRQLTPQGAVYNVSTLAGQALSPGNADGPGGTARFNCPKGMAVDGSGNIILADSGAGNNVYGYTIRQVTPGGVVSTLAGLAGSSGSADGIGSLARFARPYGVAVDNSGVVYITDNDSQTLRRGLSSNPVITSAAAASGCVGQAFNYHITASNFPDSYSATPLPGGLAVDTGTGAITGTPNATGTINVTISATNALGTGTATLAITITFPPPPVITSATTASGVVGTAFNYQITATNSPSSYDATPLPAGLSVNTNTGAITGTPTITGTTSATISATNAGGTGSATLTITITPPSAPVITSATTASGYVGLPFSYNITATNSPTSYSATGLPAWASVNTSTGAITGTPTAAGTTSATISATNAGGTGSATLTITINTISTSLTITTMAGSAGNYGRTDGTGSNARFNGPNGVALDSSGNVYVSDFYNHTIRKITPASVVSTLAGLGGSTGSTDGTGGNARFNGPNGVAVDSSGNVYVADFYNHTIRKITPAAVVSTLAGLAGTYGSADGTGSAARFYYPAGVAVDGSGNVCVADYYNHTIRIITSAGAVSTLAGLAGSSGSADGTGSAARFYTPNGVSVDGSGNVYVADYKNYTIRKITSAGVVSTLAGLALSSGSADGTGSSARFYYPAGVAVDGSGSLYVADTFNDTIRMINSSGGVSTVAGLAGSSGSADGTGSAARFNRPFGVAMDSSGHVYVADTYNHTIRRSLMAPIITSPTAANGTAGHVFSYSITATENPTSFSASGLPAWASVNTSTGAITGTPTTAGTTSATLSATNAAGAGSGPLAITVNPGPLAKFALALSSPQMNGSAFTGVNTLTAQDAFGNTVATFDASVDSVRITANAPLAGDVYRLGTGNNNVLNRATDFVAGVADLTALRMIFVGNYATGTFTATSATGKSGISGSVTINGPGPGQPGKDMQVVMWLTIPKSVSIAWGAGTTGKTAGDVTPLNWRVRDAGGDQLGLRETCVSNDDKNNMEIKIENMSNTGTNARVSAAVVNTGGWNIAAAPATNTFAIKAQLGANQQVVLAASAQELTGTATLAKGADQALVLTVMTPTDITRDLGVEKTMCVVLTATPE